MRLVSWNVNGFRAVHGRGDLKWAFDADDIDVIALQETKIQPDAVTDEMLAPKGWSSFWSFGKKKGYSGTAVYVRDRVKAETFRVDGSEFKVGGADRPEFDDEGRVVALDLGAVVLFNIYFPNGASGPDRLAYKAAWHEAFMQRAVALSEKRSVVVCGDLNIGHKPIDVAKPDAWCRQSGFLPDERAWLDRFLAKGFIDTFRAEKGEMPRQYTYWETRVDARKDNIGWRIDYFFISKDLEEKQRDAWIWPQVKGSDHCPVGLELDVVSTSAGVSGEGWGAAGAVTGADEDEDEDGGGGGYRR